MSSLGINICVIIYKFQYNEEALDFILAAANLTENISVIFIQEAVQQIHQFKALKGFEINNIYSEKESMEKYNISLDYCIINPQIISRDKIKHYVTHCQQIFTF